jgi:hypothetical protein
MAGIPMQGTDHDDNLSGQSQGRKPAKRFLFWLEISVLTVGVAVCAALVVSDCSLVKSRREVLMRYKGDPEFICVRRNELPSAVSERMPNVSWLRRILGDEAIRMILLPRGTTGDDEIARVREVFPEAKVELLPIETKRVNNRSGLSSRSPGLSG